MKTDKTAKSVQDAKNIFDKCVAFALEISTLGNKRKVKSEKMKLREGEGEQPDPKAIGVSKSLLSCPEFDKIVSLDGRIRLDILLLALPSPLKRGVYLVPLSNLEAVDEMVQKYKKEREGLVQSFIKVYEKTVLEARSRLGGLFNPGDYMSKECVESCFSVRTSYLEMGLPGNLKTISPEIFKREKAEFSEKLRNAAEEVQQALRVEFADFVTHLADRLAPGEDGKPKQFKKGSIEKFSEFLNAFNNKNIAEDNELEELVKKARSILNGRDAEVLRNNQEIRDVVQAEFVKIGETVSTMIEVKPLRKFNFSDDE